jgi:hypothetical protein
VIHQRHPRVQHAASLAPTWYRTRNDAISPIAVPVTTGARL